MPAMESRTSSMARPCAVELDQRGKTHERDHQRAAMADLLEAAAISRQRVAFDRHQQFAIVQRGAVGAGDEIGELHAAADDLAAVVFRQLHFRFMRDQAGRGVGGGRGVDDIAADGRLRADLVVGEPHRATRHRRQCAAELWVVEETLDGGGGAEPHALVVDAQFIELGDFGNVDQHRDIDVAGAALARPGKRVGAAGDDTATAAMLRQGGEGLGERRRRQVFVAGEHDRQHLLSFPPPCGRGSEEASRVRGRIHLRH